MSSSYNNPSKHLPVQVTLEYFRKASTSPCIQQSPCLISFTQNNIVNACSFVYVCNAVKLKQYERMMNELTQELDFERIILTHQPEIFREFMAQQTIAGVIRCGLTKLEKVVREKKYQVRDIQKQLSLLCNGYPFFRFCLGLWARCKAILYLQQQPPSSYLLIGNEPQLLRNLTTQIRNAPLDILCHSLDINLKLKSGQVEESYGRKGGHQFVVKLINKEIRYEINTKEVRDKGSREMSEASSSLRKSNNASTSNMSSVSRGKQEEGFSSSKEEIILCECLGHCRCIKRCVGFLSPKYAPNEQYGFTPQKNNAKWKTYKP